MKIMIVHRKTYHDEDIFKQVAIKALRVSSCPVIMHKGEPAFLVAADREEAAQQIVKVLNDAFATEMTVEYVSLTLPFKDETAFRQYGQFVCYVPTDEEAWYTPEMFHDLCSGDGQMAKRIFDLCAGQKPQLLIEDILNA